ncbi:MAG TPA: NADH-quinone oxidoreductase subunit F [Actinobacteria bacterium]|nr:NADH-quinone oxidoreductase subunit F [Actinomycetota bacterium]
MSKLKNFKELSALREKICNKRARQKKTIVRVCSGTGCRASGSQKVVEAFKKEAAKQGVDFEIRPTGCQGLCEKGPIVIVEPLDVFYQKVDPFDAAKIIDLTINRGKVIDRLQVVDPITGDLAVKEEEISFYGKQHRIVLRNCGQIDPTNIEDYIAVGGYEALAKVLSDMTPEEVIDEVKKSNLRGRGGAGFPVGRKWEGGRRTKGNIKYIVCNGDEGDPGAFMDRSVLEGDPHSVIEGMAIGAYALGNCEKGFIYVRQEYPLAVENLTIAINQARELGLLGNNILGSCFNFDLEIKRGAGAFICGESTALMFSIEGKRGMPRTTPPRSVEKGLWGKPTVLNNVETLANIAPIIIKGADWYTSIGTKGSPGTKIFALTGKVKNTGLIEVPMGVTIREIVYDIGGGILGDKEFKAVQTGGPSGGCIPKEYLDLPVDFDSLDEVGAMMGSGGLVVMDESNCMVEIARYFLSFTQVESCGKCPPCRIGTYEMFNILTRIVEGKGEEGDIERLEIIGKHIQETALCGLGKSAPNPVLSTIKYFRDEYEAHIRNRYCPAGACTALGRYRIHEEECLLCGLCKEVCVYDAIVEERDRFYIDQSYCEKCGACIGVCPTGCVVREFEEKTVSSGKQAVPAGRVCRQTGRQEVVK